MDDSAPSELKNIQELSNDERKILESQNSTSFDRHVGYFSLYRYASRSEKLGLLVCSICAVAAGSVLPLMTILFGNLGGSFSNYGQGTISHEDFDHLLRKHTLYLVYLGIASLITVYMNVAGFNYIGERLTTKIREAYFASILKQNIGFYDHVGSGEISTYMTTNINTIQDGVSQNVGLTLTGLATFVAGLVISFVESWRLALVMISVVVAIILVMGGVGKVMKGLQQRATESIGAGSTLAEETICSMRTISAIGSQNHFEKLFSSLMVENSKFELAWRAALGLLIALMMCIMSLQYGLAFWQGSRFLRAGEIDVSRLLTTILASVTAGVSFGHIAPYLGSFGAATAAAVRVFAIIDRVSPFDLEDANDSQICKNLQGNIHFKAVTHWYPARPFGPPILDHVDIEIPAGKVTAIVGASGSGKSTLISLIERFYLPVRGEILLDGHNICNLNLRHLRQQIGLVSQEPVLFSSTIYENIASGLICGASENIDEEERASLVVKAAQAANAHDFISTLPAGYQTLVGERGILLSGGQRQRIAIARAIISDPKVLLFDEATASLDAVSERTVQTALESASRGRTTIVIAHRLSTIRNADKIIVMSQGRVVEEGTHEVLTSRQGLYFSLSQIQNIQMEDHERDKGEFSEQQPSSTVIAKHEDSEEYISNTSPFSQTIDQNPMYGPYMSPLELIRFVWSLSHPERKVIVSGFIIAFLAGAVYPIQGIFFGNAVLDLQYNLSGRGINFWAGMFLMLGLVAFVLYTLQGITFAFSTARLIHRSRLRAYSALLGQDIAFFDKSEASAGALLTFVTTDIQNLAGVGGATLGAVVNFVSTLVTAIAISCSFGWKLALVCIATMPVLLFCGFLRTWILTRLERRISENTSTSTLACEAVSAIRTVASLTLEEKLSRQYQEGLKSQTTKYLPELLYASLLYALSQSLSLFVMALAFWYGGTLIVTGEYTVKQFFVCFVSAIWGAQAAAGIFSYANETGKARQACERLRYLLERNPPIDSRSKAGIFRELKGAISLKNIHFSYPARSDQSVLRGVTLSARPGQFVAIVGPSGSGKSTIISLLERFYDPQSGSITIDEEEISEYNVQALRGQMSLVSQETMLYHGSIRDNIVAGLPDVRDDVIVQACQDANIWEFINSLPDGLSSLVGSKGCLLSGGQRQRLAIARALVRNPRILLLDEATSALDSESERVVQIALDKASQGRTTIAIAHRLSTIQHADIIYVMSSETVVEQGTHLELMALRGLYWKLATVGSQRSLQ